MADVQTSNEGGLAVRVLDDDAWRQWQDDCRPPDVSPFVLRVQTIAEQGWAPVIFRESGRMSWVCPQCGSCTGGQLGDVPVSGWDEPRWVLTGPVGKPTLAPSLGCPNWRDGHCGGHYWLRNGRLVLA